MAHTAVITGCTNGLGYHALRSLAKDSSTGTVVLACRNVHAAKQAAEKLTTEMKLAKDKLVVLDEPCNLSDTASVKAYAVALIKMLSTTNKRINSLVNNAGIGGNPAYRKTTQGFEEIWATNHLGHFALTLALLPHMAEGGIIVNVSSEVHNPANKTGMPDADQYWPTTDAEYDSRLARGEPIEGEAAFTSGGRRYTRSKLCNVLFTDELALRLSGAVPNGVDAAGPVGKALLSDSSRVRVCTLPAARSFRVLSFNPGLMLDTAFVTAAAGTFAGWLAWALTPLIRLTAVGKFIRTGAVSGAVLAQLATGAIAPKDTAAFYDGPDRKLSSDFSLSHQGAVVASAELWKHSVRWAGVDAQTLQKAGLQ